MTFLVTGCDDDGHFLGVFRAIWGWHGACMVGSAVNRPLVEAQFMERIIDIIENVQVVVAVALGAIAVVALVILPFAIFASI